MAVDVVDDLPKVESVGFNCINSDLQEAFPLLDDMASDELSALVDAWGHLLKQFNHLRKW